MATTGALIFLANLSPTLRRETTSASGKLSRRRISNRSLTASSELTRTASAMTTTVADTETTPLRNLVESKGRLRSNYSEESEVTDEINAGMSLKDYFKEAKVMIRSDGGPPRWFSPLDCGSHAPDSPLLLYLPGIDGVGVGVGLVKQRQKLGQIFDIWCLHIPVKDRTSFTALIKLVEGTVRSESDRLPNRPIYILGESIGGCLALAVAARNPHIDLVLILANPATSFSRSQCQRLQPLLEIMPEQVLLNLPFLLNFFQSFLPPQISLSADPSRTAVEILMKGFPQQQEGGNLSEDLAIVYYLSAIADILPKETLLWRLKMLKSASAYANSRLHAVKAQTLVLSSGRDQLFPSQKEGERLYHTLSNCQTRSFDYSGHFLFLEDGINMVTVVKGAGFYRRGKSHDCVRDYIPPTPSEFKRVYESYRWLHIAADPVVLSTLEDGRVVRGLDGVPSEGPVLYVGYHMLLGLDLGPLVCRFMLERNILLRGIAHPMMFTKSKEGMMPELSIYDNFRLMGAVPVSAINFFKLLSSKSHVLLYPGGVREALHRKGEEYKLFWPEQSEFVRMAARCGAKIVPFGAVGEDDLGQVVIDYDDLRKIPYFRDNMEALTNEAVRLRTDASGELANQHIHLPGVLPKVPGRFYYYIGKLIETKGRKQELRDKDKCHELYLEVKSEVEKCLSYLKEKREKDPYRNILPRLIYQVNHGFTSEVPTFDL